MKKQLLSPHFLLPVAIVLGLSLVGVRAIDMLEVIASGKLWMRPAQAESAPAKKEETKAPAKEETAHTPAKEEAPKAAAATHPEPPKESMPPPPDASAAEMDVLKQLSDRREQLEKRSRDLDTRESLLKITEQRVAQKIKEMETLRQQLQSMVNQANGAQQAQLENLVKIYETMKPDEAAKIFETLDMPVLLGVFQRMKPARTAPIMAKMAPEKAKEITVALTKQDQLPQIK